MHLMDISSHEPTLTTRRGKHAEVVGRKAFPKREYPAIGLSAPHSACSDWRGKLHLEKCVRSSTSLIDLKATAESRHREPVVPKAAGRGGGGTSRCRSAAYSSQTRLESTMLWWWGSLCILVVLFHVGTSEHLVKEFTSARREATRSMEPDKGSDHGDLGSLDIGPMLCERYADWTEWSSCSRKCEQTRVRKCRIPEQCGRSWVKEKRTCTRNKGPCSPLSYKVIGIQRRNRLIEELLYDLLYSTWTSWGSCTRSCRQRRQRTCKFMDVCLRSYIQEERRCQVAGSECEHRFSLKPVAPRPEGQEDDSDITNKNDNEEEDVDYDEEVMSEDGEEEGEVKKDDQVEDEDESDTGDTDEENDRKNRKKNRNKNKKGRSKFRKAKMTMLNRLDREKVGALGQEVIQAQEDCGVRPKLTSGSYRVVGGQEVQRNSWPWQVAIMTRNHEQYCGGTLIAPRWVLTAAHCVIKKNKRRKLLVRVGEHDMDNDDPSQQDIRPEEEFYHPEFDYHTITNDIALIKLQHPPSAFSQPSYACLPSTRYKPPRDQLCSIVGWGKLKNTHIYGSDRLQEVQVPVVRHRKCQHVFDYPITADQVCAGYRQGGKDSCAGDSGGPLLCHWHDRGTERYVLYGVTSYGEGCGRRGKYGIYTKVSSYLDWIYKTISENR